MRKLRNTLLLFTIFSLALSTQSCEGGFGFVYDEQETVKAVDGQIYIDASDWKTWYYIDLNAITDSLRNNSAYDASASVTSREIPMTAVGDTLHTNGHQRAGQYMYWYDIFGKGLSENKFQYYTPTAEQDDPANWTFAIHRNNVRTNGGSAYETQLTDINAVTKADYAAATFTEDTWSENEVWDDQTLMLMKYVPSQGINTNKVLSSWLRMEITTPPPTFYHNNHVFILRLKDNTYAALQLADYISPAGTKCCMTIKYRYPLTVNN